MSGDLVALVFAAGACIGFALGAYWNSIQFGDDGDNPGGGD